MSFRFREEVEPGHDCLAALSALAPDNPFYTPEHAEFRRRQGDTPVLLALENDGVLAGGATAFMRSGRMSRSLEIPSRPLTADDAVFWDGLRRFCDRSRVTALAVNSFASPPGLAPSKGLGREIERRARREFILDLTGDTPLRKMRKGHAYEVKRGEKAGLALRRTIDPAAAETHVSLMNASMQRRLDRGEDVGLTSQIASFRNLLQSGAAALYQAWLGETAVSSNMILLAPLSGYNHTQGTHPDGMNCGAAHFLIRETALALKSEGKSLFNLGGTDQLGGGLERFKTGFGADTASVDADAAAFSLGGRMRRIALAAQYFFGRAS